MAKSPTEIMVIGLIETLWKQMKESSSTVFREIGQNFVEEYERIDLDLSTPESSLKSINQYFTDVFEFADNIEYKIDDEFIYLTVQGCSFRPMTDHFETNGTPRTACPIANSAAAALEKVTGDIYLFDHVVLTSKDVCNLVLKKFEL